MTSTRTTTLALAALGALTAATLAVAPAHAGGAPDFSTVTVDRQARLASGVVTLGGSYSCTVPDAAVTSGPGTLGLELADGSGVVATGEVGVTCDGVRRPWTLTAPAGSLGAGRAWVDGHVAVTDSAGNTPWDGFSARVAVVRRG